MTSPGRAPSARTIKLDVFREIFNRVRAVTQDGRYHPLAYPVLYCLAILFGGCSRKGTKGPIDCLTQGSRNRSKNQRQHRNVALQHARAAGRPPWRLATQSRRRNRRLDKRRKRRGVVHDPIHILICRSRLPIAETIPRNPDAGLAACPRDNTQGRKRWRPLFAQLSDHFGAREPWRLACGTRCKRGGAC